MYNLSLKLKPWTRGIKYLLSNVSPFKITKSIGCFCIKNVSNSFPPSVFGCRQMTRMERHGSFPQNLPSFAHELSFCLLPRARGILSTRYYVVSCRVVSCAVDAGRVLKRSSIAVALVRVNCLPFRLGIIRLTVNYIPPCGNTLHSSPREILPRFSLVTSLVGKTLLVPPIAK